MENMPLYVRSVESDKVIVISVFYRSKGIPCSTLILGTYPGDTIQNFYDELVRAGIISFIKTDTNEAGTYSLFKVKGIEELQEVSCLSYEDICIGTSTNPNSIERLLILAARTNNIIYPSSIEDGYEPTKFQRAASVAAPLLFFYVANRCAPVVPATIAATLVARDFVRLANDYYTDRPKLNFL